MYSYTAIKCGHEIDRPTTKPLHPEKVVVEQAGLELVDEYVGATITLDPVLFRSLVFVAQLLFLGRFEKIRSATLGLCCSTVLYVKNHLLRFSPKF